jgi:hypothetical protein
MKVLFCPFTLQPPPLLDAANGAIIPILNGRDITTERYHKYHRDSRKGREFFYLLYSCLEAKCIIA